MKIDGILLEVIGNTFMSIAEEMGAVLVKSAYSTNIKERKDCSCALFDAEGHTIAQAEHIPMHLGSLLGLIGEIKKNFTPDQIHPGDMFIANDPYNGGGTHLPDIAVASPVFYEDKVVAMLPTSPTTTTWVAESPAPMPPTPTLSTPRASGFPR